MSDVKILVKDVYAPTEDQQFILADTITIHMLKDMLQQAIADHPLPKHQKLIFGGKICEDGDTLDVILGSQRQQASAGENDTTYVFHLMVTSNGPRLGKEPTKTSSTIESIADTVSESEPSGPPPVPEIHSSTADTVYPSQHQSPQHLHHMHHMHLLHQQTMLISQIQYWQHMYAFYSTSTQPPQPLHYAYNGQYPIFNTFGHHPLPQQHYPGAAQPGYPAYPLHGGQAAPVPGMTPAPVPAPAVRRAGAIVQALREIAPLLDLRLAMKMSFMLFIIGQDTPMDRIIMLGIISLISYLHITGILAKMYELFIRGNNNENGAAANVENDANATDPAPAPAADTGMTGVATFSQLLRISSERGFLQDARYFFSGLVLSLVPAWHPQPLVPGEPAEAVRENADDVPAEVPPM